MSDATDHSLPESELLAAEYALGVLDGAEREAAAKRVIRDAAFARAVAAWEQRLAPWAAGIKDVQPSAQVWDRITAALPGAAAPRASLWDSLAFWRGLTFATGALAAACVAALVYIGNFTQPTPLVASLAGGGQNAFVAAVDPRRGTVMIVPASFAQAPERVPELWLIAPGDKPRSLGLIDPSKPVTLTIPASLLAQANAQATLAVSLEPPGGSRTGAPTGPVIATGRLTNL